MTKLFSMIFAAFVSFGTGVAVAQEIKGDAKAGIVPVVVPRSV